MKPISTLLALIGMAVPSMATVNAVDRSQRNFRIDPTTGVVYADIVVAYEPPPAPLSAYSTPAAQQAFLTGIFQQASLDLFTASKGAVQLGQVTIVPYIINGTTTKVDPDVIVLADKFDATDPTNVSKLSCPGDLGRAGDIIDGVTVCADANTGGYLGLKWWEDVKIASGGPTFQKITIPGSTVANPAPPSQGANIAITWNTLKQANGSRVLVHEFGHYLFAMRDEYEAQSIIAKNGALSPQETFEAALSQDPKLFAGVALVDASASKLSWDFLTKFNGYGMSLTSLYQPDKGYSPAALAITGTLKPEISFYSEDDFTDQYIFTEQIASIPTRGVVGDARQNRYGGMWSLETAIRTGLDASYTPAKYVDALGKIDLSKHNSTTEGKVNFYGDGQANIFVFDRSGSMIAPITSTSSTISGVTRWDAAVDFFGRLSHPKTGAGSTVEYRSDAKFGFIAFDHTIVSLASYPSPLAEITQYTVPYAYSGTGVDKKLAWMSNTSKPVPGPGGATNLVGALGTAQLQLDNYGAAPTSPLPVQRNVILLTDGQHNFLNPEDFNTKIGLDGRYRIFAVSVDNDLADQALGDTLQKLALKSVGPEGVHGSVCYADGDNTKNQLTVCANRISDEIAQMNVVSLAPSQLYRDAARAFPIAIDRGQTRLRLSLAWDGSIAPTTYLSGPNNQTFPEGNYPGIVFKKDANFKTYDIDLTKFSMDNGADTVGWKLHAAAYNASTPVTIYPSLSAKSSRLQVDATFDPTFVNPTGRLPVTVTVKDGRAIEGLEAVGTLSNNKTGVTQSIPLSWNGSTYVGALAGNLQPGVNDLLINVSYPRTGKAYYARGENRVDPANRTAYPYFTTKPQSMQVWVPGAAKPKTISGLEVKTINLNPSFAQGTPMKLFIKNKTALNFKGLKVRYFYSVSEIAGGVPSVQVNNLPGGSIVTTGTVTGRPGLAYVQFDFAGKMLKAGDSTSNGSNGGEDVVLIAQGWKTPWNSANDWSAQGLKSTWATNAFVNVYDSLGALIIGNPDLEPRTNMKNASPIVNLATPDLLVAGTPALFVANAIDPEGDTLAFTWTVDGVVVGTIPAKPSELIQTFATAGVHSVSVKVSDGKSTAVTVSASITVQSTANACSQANSRVFGSASSNSTFTLVAGANCFVIPADSIRREWSWSKLQVQLNSDNGVSLSGLSVTPVPTGSTTNLSGYSQTVPFNDPGRTKSLYFKVQATGSRTVRTNWWLQ